MINEYMYLETTQNVGQIKKWVIKYHVKFSQKLSKLLNHDLSLIKI